MDKPQTTQPRRRRRPMHSCWECRRRKIKCDRNDPCAHCVRQETQCIFTTHGPGESSEFSRAQRSGLKVTPRAAAAGSGLSVTGGAGSDSGYGGSAIPGASPGGSASLLSAIGPSHPFSALVDAAVLEQRGQTSPGSQDGAGTIIARASVAPSPSANANTTSSASNAVIQTLLKRIKNLGDSFATSSPRNADHTKGRLGSVAEPHESTRPAWQDTIARHANNARRNSVAAVAGDWQDVVRNKPSKLGRTRRMGDAPDFAAIIQCYSVMMGLRSKDVFSHVPEIKDLLAEGAGLLVESKHVAERLKIGRPSRPADMLSAGSQPRLSQHLTLPTRDRADAMVKLYFESFESAYRILHAPTFWTSYEKHWQAPESTSNAIYLQVLLVVAIGSSLHNHGDSNAVLDNIEMCRPWIVAAEHWLADPFAKDRMNIAGFQVNCLCIVARQIFNVAGDLIWTSIGTLLYRALQAGLHREPGRLPGVSVFQAELRRRLWATILDMFVQASLDALIPPMMSLDEFDVETPSNINDEEMDEFTTSIVPHPRTTFTSTSVQLALLDTLSLRFGIVQYLYGMQSEQSYSSVLSLSSQLANALSLCNNSLDAMSLQSKDQAYDIDMETDNIDIASRSITIFQRNLLDFLVRRFMTPLHMFFATQSHANPVFHYSLTVSLDAALALVSPTKMSINSTNTMNISTSPGGNIEELNLFDRLLSMAGGLFREGFRSALTIISLALLVHATTQQASGTLHRAPQHRESLKAAVHTLVALAERRIRNGDTNIRAYMFLNMVLAQVGAVEAGWRAGDEAFEMALANGAVKSLRFCRDVIKARAETRLLPENGSGGGGEEMEFIDAADGMGSCFLGQMEGDAFGLDWEWESLLTTMDMADGGSFHSTPVGGY